MADQHDMSMLLRNLKHLTDVRPTISDMTNEMTPMTFKSSISNIIYFCNYDSE